MHQVWKLHRWNMGSDAYVTSRTLAAEFPDEQSARQFVLENHRRNSEFIIAANRLQGPERDQ